MNRIEDVEKPIIGRYYDVPCVRVTANGAGWYEGMFVPVIGPLHEDAELIDFPHNHFHPDLRFATQATMEYKLTGCSLTLGNRAPKRVFASVITKFDAEVGVVRKRRRCRRHHPTFPKARWTKNLTAKYAGMKAKCHVCPHRGVSIKDAPVRGGKLICPGHGLAFDRETLICQPRGRR